SRSALGESGPPLGPPRGGGRGGGGHAPGDRPAVPLDGTWTQSGQEFNLDLERLPPPASPSPLADTWSGILEPPGAQLRLLFEISQQDDALTGRLVSVDQNNVSFPLDRIALDERAVRLEASAVKIVFVGTLSKDGDRLTGHLQQGPEKLPLELRRGVVFPTVEKRRPQEPKPPYPYLVEELRFPSPEAGLELAATLTRPPGDGPFPGVVLVSGSGPQNRDQEIFDHKPFWVLADHLTRQGFAVLRYDERGVGESAGDFASATTADLAQDTTAAVRFLRSNPAVDSSGVGILGHSEGGIIAPMVAAADPESVAFLVLLGAPAVPGKELLVRQSQAMVAAAGASPEEIEQQGRLQRRILDTVLSHQAPDDLRKALEGLLDELAVPAAARSQQMAQMTALASPWMKFFLRHDPGPDLEKVHCPVLALYGEKDLQVDAETNLAALRAALARADNADVETAAMAALNHLFQTAETGLPAEYEAIEETLAPALLDRVGEWLEKRFQAP
ncbi:MAG: alpha/beta fold hydrolase, partial [Acidobacteriota bacterium]